MEKLHPLTRNLTGSNEDIGKKAALGELQVHLLTWPQLAVLDPKEPMSLCLKASGKAVSVAMVREENGKQFPVCFTSKLLSDNEAKLAPEKRLELALASECHRMKPYLFQHLVKVVTSLWLGMEKQPLSDMTGISDFAKEFDGLKIDFAQWGWETSLPLEGFQEDFYV